MLKTFFIALASLLLAVSAEAYEMNSVTVDQSAGLVIGSEARCVESRGIPIQEVADNQVKVACLRDRNVRWACNADGSHARVKAFREWSSQLMEFKDRCSTVGGVFAFSDSTFQEPTDSSFCSVAQPEVEYSGFETPMCNFVSQCPKVAVTCARDEDIIRHTQRTVFLPGIPKAIDIAIAAN